MFYMNHSLVSSLKPNSWFTDNPLLDKDTIVQRLLSSNNEYGGYIKEGIYTPGTPFIEVTKTSDYDKADIALLLPLLKGEKVQYTAKLARITLATTYYNCGSIHVSNLYHSDGYYTHLAWDLLQHVEDWCKWCGYTMLFGNVAGNDQIKLLPKFLDRGWTEMGVRYKNQRSRNVNIWLQKIIQNQDNIEEEPDEDDDYYEEDDDYYEEDDSDSDEEF